MRPVAESEELKELRGQIQAQSALLAQQQRRIEELEVKLAALAAKAQPAHVTPASPARLDLDATGDRLDAPAALDLAAVVTARAVPRR